MLLGDFEYRVATSKCDRTAVRMSAVAEFEADISCVFPYLSTVFPGCEFNASIGFIRLESNGRVYALHPRMIMTGVADISEAQQVFGHIRDMINDTWERRDEITPCESRRVRGTAIEVYKLLPKTNCKECGERTCMAFAAKLTVGTARLEECPTMEPAVREQLEQRLE